MLDEVILSIDGIEIRLGHASLASILFMLEWDGPIMPLEPQKMQALFIKLAQSSDPKIREFVADRDFISPEIIELLSNDPQINVVRELAGNASAARQITQAQALRFLKRNDDDLLETLGRCLDWYSLCDPIALGEPLCKHPNPRVRAALAENQEVPEQLLQHLLEDKDLDVAKKARHSLNDKLEYETSFEDDLDDDEDTPNIMSH